MHSVHGFMIPLTCCLRSHIVVECSNTRLCRCSAGKRIANIMQGKKVLLAANHGVIVATDTIAEAFDYLYFLERAAEVQLKALASGKPLKLIDEAICIETCEKFTKSGVAREVGAAFTYCILCHITWCTQQVHSTIFMSCYL